MNKHNPIWYVFLIVALYVVLSMIVYRLKNPTYTETQLLLHIVDAIMWR